MIETRKKIERMSRIHGIESTRMNALVNTLHQVDARLSAQMQQLERLQQMRDQSLTPRGDVSVSALTQMSVWIEDLNQSIAKASKTVKAIRQERHEAQSRVMDQRARVRGMELLIEQLRMEVDLSSQNEQIVVADENAIQDYARN